MAGREPVLNLTVKEETHRVRLVVEGDIDLVTAAEFRRVLADTAARHERLVLDLTGVVFIGSVGISALYRHADRLAAVLVAPGSLIARALSIAGFSMLIQPTVVGEPRSRRPPPA
ncbi:STAS domain-containing protein [Pseudonocardia spinosispora]|uniref:STAS domain-containing protein n=1 Tax=Pseudonocardia spinosispora TaxID=103441 RepID=UPI0003F97AE1|nr:STAS domain-containing protein [Pseudonocardia spinosispora]